MTLEKFNFSEKLNFWIVHRQRRFGNALLAQPKKTGYGQAPAPGK
jgi:hypothetical protein